MAEVNMPEPLETGQALQEAPIVDTGEDEKRSGLGSWRALSISILICLTQLIQMIQFGSGIGGATAINARLGGTRATASWIAASYPLTAGAFILIGGRIGALYGHKTVLVIAGAAWTLFSLITGFTHSLVAVCLLRGLAGVGGGFITPNAIALLTTTFPPGPRRNLSVAGFAAMAPVGAAGGSVFAGLFVQLTPWRWLFFFLAMVGAVVFAAVWFVVPGEREPLGKGGRMDWVGAYLGIGGLVLFSFVWNQAPAVGWTTPYEYILLIVSILHFVAFALWEGLVAGAAAIMPLDIWTAPSFFPLVLVCFLSFMAFGVHIWYFVTFTLEIRGYSILLGSAAVAPLTVLGVVGAALAAWLVPRLAAQWIIVIGDASILAAMALLATAPARQTYWAQLFPSAVLMAFCPGFIFTAAQIIASGAVKMHEQGVTASMVGVLFVYGMSAGLGFAGTVQAYTEGGDVLGGYRHALYLGMGMAAAALVLDLLFVRMPKVRHGEESEAGDGQGGEEVK